ncbi:MAG: transporter [Gammaproteobacteria bacterium]|nr:transporter [Gammaproteobacteria bacterium]
MTEVSGFQCQSALLLALLGFVLSAQAQQLEPRAFAPNPVGINFVAIGASRTEGGVLLDASSPIQDFEIKVTEPAVGYGRTFAIGSRVASLGLVVPYAHGDARGTVEGVPEAVHRSGFGDLQLRFTTSLLAGSALTPAEFARDTPDWTLGASLVVIAPTGEYMEDRLINIGTNRWAFKPEIGGSRQFGRWNLESSIAAWFFTRNSDFVNGPKQQDPIGAIQGHVSYTFKPRMWLAASLTWYAGGRSLIAGQSQRDTQNSTRGGLTLSVPVGDRQSVKFLWQTGISTRIGGGDFDTLGIAWQYAWLD